MKKNITRSFIAVLLACLVFSCANRDSVSYEKSDHSPTKPASLEVFAPPVPPPIETMQDVALQDLQSNGFQNWVSLLRNKNGGAFSGSRECLSALPDQYKNGVIDMTSDNGSPDPKIWFLTIKSLDNAFGLRYLEFENGQFVKDTGISIFANIFWSHTPMVLNENIIDSRMVYELAKKTASSRGYTISSALFQLKKYGKSCEPAWTAWCYGLNDKYLGLIEVRAIDGSIISVKGFK